MNATSKERASRLSDARRSERTVTQAKKATDAWEAAVQDQRLLRLPDHGGFYALAAEVVSTLRRLEDLCALLTVQVAGYGDTATAVGGVLRDDVPGHDPAERVAVAASWAARTGHLLGQAQQAAAQFWVEIGHVAIDQPDSPTDNSPTDADTGTDGGGAGGVAR